MDSIRENVSRRAAFELSTWKSVQAETLESIEPLQSRPERTRIFDTTTSFYAENASGQRYSEFYFILNGKPTGRQELFFDGRKSSMVKYDKENLTKQSAFFVTQSFGTEDKSIQTDRPIPLRVYYVGLSPIYDKINDAKILSPDEWQGKSCNRLLFETSGVNFSPKFLIYYFDITNFCPLRIIAYRELADGHEGRHPTWEWHAIEQNTIQDHIIPTKSEWVYFGKDENTPIVKHTFVVTNCKFDAFSRKVQFSAPEVQANALYMNAITKRAVAPPDHTANSFDVKTKASVLQKIDTSEHGADSVFVVSKFAFVVGVVFIVLGIGIVIGRRFRFVRKS